MGTTPTYRAPCPAVEGDDRAMPSQRRIPPATDSEAVFRLPSVVHWRGLLALLGQPVLPGGRWSTELTGRFYRLERKRLSSTVYRPVRKTTLGSRESTGSSTFTSSAVTVCSRRRPEATRCTASSRWTRWGSHGRGSSPERGPSTGTTSSSSILTMLRRCPSPC